MAFKIQTISAGLIDPGTYYRATLIRASDGYYWNNTTGLWQLALPTFPTNAITFALEDSPYNCIYSGSPSVSLGNAGWVDIYIHAPSSGIVSGIAEAYILGGEEIRPIYAADGSITTDVDLSGVLTAIAGVPALVDTALDDEFAAIPAAVDAVLVGNFAAIPAAVNAALVVAHNDGNWASPLGSGLDSVTITVLCDGLPVQSANVWITTDAAGSNVEVSLATNASGQIATYLTDGQTYYAFIQVSGYNSIVSEAFVASATAGNEFTLTEVAAVAGAGTSVYDLMPLVQPFCNAPNPVVQLALRVASKEFFDRTGAWTETQTTTLVAANPVLPQQLEGDAFHLLTSYEAVTRRVKYVREATVASPITETTSKTSESQYRVTADEHIIFTADRNADAVLEIEKTMTPTTACVTFPAELITRWGYALANGALSKIFRMPQFANANFYQLYAGAFEQDIVDAAIERQQARKSGERVLPTPKTF